MAAWACAARDARGCGSQVVANEYLPAVMVGQAIGAAGGVREVPADKRYASNDGGPRVTRRMAGVR